MVFSPPSPYIPADNAAVEALWASNPRLVAAVKSQHFRTAERHAVFHAVESHGDAAFTNLIEEEWLRFRDVGPGFICKIKPLGWVRSHDYFKGRCRNAVANQLGLLHVEELTRDVLMNAIKEKRLIPGDGGARNYGVGGHREVCDWLGIPYTDTSGRRRWKFDPFTGKPLADARVQR
jgi:hypothetical protein